MHNTLLPREVRVANSYFLVRLSPVLLFLFFAQDVSGQELLSGSSGYGSNGNVKIAWTLGELATDTYSTAIATLSQGSLQYSLNVTSVSAEISQILHVFPNPAEQVLFLSVLDEREIGCHYELIDGAGKVHARNAILSTTTEISVSQLTPAIYFLKVITTKEQVNIFKIVKK